MQFQFINSQDAFNAVCKSALNASFVALDTEFVRTRTYYPKLGLIQLFDGTHLSLIDPLEINDWQPFIQLLENEATVKVLHSCSEDMEVFLCYFKTVPTPLFDTQFAAGLLGFGASLGYAKLVADFLDVALDKGESRTDWLQRPLSAEQLQYAANDVEYLYQLYPLLKAKTDECQRTQWVFDEMAQLALKKRHGLPSDYAYLTIKNNWQLSGKSLMALKLIAGWRLDKAREQDMALNFIIRETSVLDIARNCPTDKRTLANLGCLSGKELRLYGDEIIALVKQALDSDESAYPTKVKRLPDVSGYKKTLHALREICLKKSESDNIKPELLASKNQINQLLKWHWFTPNEFEASGLLPDLATGWRKHIVYDELMAFLTRTSPE
ncbi:ribonuclease D [Alteromonas sp. a30]|nr:ribonuclease D [Alteromonas sp. a30]